MAYCLQANTVKHNLNKTATCRTNFFCIHEKRHDNFIIIILIFKNFKQTKIKQNTNEEAIDPSRRISQNRTIQRYLQCINPCTSTKPRWICLKTFHIFYRKIRKCKNCTMQSFCQRCTPHISSTYEWQNISPKLRKVITRGMHSAPEHKAFFRD